jgi:two-component system nitrogen regulation response regulator NtrX
MMQPRTTILVIEDDDGIRELVAGLLMDDGYQTLLLPSARTALVAIQAQPPDLIVLDVWMEHPDSGWQLLAALRHDLATRTIPVVVTSAHVWMMAEMMVRFPEAHYTFLKKPFDTTALLREITRLLMDRRRGAPDG